MAGSRLLVQMAGHAGSGKPTMARQIADRIGAVVIDMDTIKSALLDRDASWEDASRWSYAIIYGLVDDVLATAGAKVIVDTPSYWDEIHERLTGAAAKHDAGYVFIECEAEESIRAQRLRQRATQRSQVRALTVNPVDAPADLQILHLRPIRRPADFQCLLVPTDRPVDLGGSSISSRPAASGVIGGHGGARRTRFPVSGLGVPSSQPADFSRWCR
jgi:predicted kinase